MPPKQKPIETQLTLDFNGIGPCHEVVWPTAKVQGYPVRRLKGKLTGLHRISWLNNYGDIPENMCVLHKCDNPLCINPEHLFLGTRADNMEDMISKGRAHHPKGITTRGRPSLTDRDVRNIRAIGAPDWQKASQLSNMYNVTPQTIWRIVNNKTWRDI